MSLTLYMDEHVPSAISDGLRSRNIDVLTIQDDHLLGESDLHLLNRASELGRVLFTRDTDFLEEAHRHQQNDIAFAGIVYAHQLQVSIGQCITDLELLAAACEPAEMMNRVEYLPL